MKLKQTTTHLRRERERESESERQGGEREDSSTEGKVKKRMGTNTYAADFESQTTCQQLINQPTKQTRANQQQPKQRRGKRTEGRARDGMRELDKSSIAKE